MSGLDLILLGFFKSATAPLVSVLGKELTQLTLFILGGLTVSKLLDIKFGKRVK